MRRPLAVAIFLAACSFEPGRFAALPEAGAGDPEAGAGGTEAGTNPEGGVTNAEAGTACTQGIACDDMNACTEYDACVSGACRGIDNLCPANCAITCTACGLDTCCRETCPTGSTCPQCPAGCSCDLSCGTSRPCAPTCGAGASCKFVGTDSETDGNYAVTCQSGSSCVVDCVGDEGSCVVTCDANAACLVIDSMSAAGTTLDCPTGAVTCSGPDQDIKVCNRPCP